MKATDLDAGFNALILYESVNASFQIDTDGFLSCNENLDNTKSPYMFSVTAKDRNGTEPYLIDMTSVILYVKNKNTHKPVFSREVFLHFATIILLTVSNFLLLFCVVKSKEVM